jgi:hypothetical protein
MSSAPAQTSFARSVFVIALAVLICYGVVCTFGFTNFEDQVLITNNPNLNPATLGGLWNHWRAPHIFLYIPVTYTFWWLLAQVARVSTPDVTGATLNPWFFHAANVVLHLLCCILVLQLLRRVLPRRGRFEGPALFGALLFALHPLQVEPVAWTTGTKDVLSGAFAFASILLYVMWAQDLAVSARRRRLRYVCGMVCLLLAMLSKPGACVVPLMVGIVDWLLLRRPLRAVVVAIVPWLILTLPILLVTRIVQPAVGIANVSLPLRPLVAADALAFYLWKLVWPFKLTIDYGRSPGAILASGAIHWTWIAPVAVAIGVMVLRKRWLTASFLLFIAGVLPVLGLTTFLFQRYSTVADRFMYLSMFGVAIAGAFAASLRWTRPVAMGCGVIVALLGARSFNQALTWRNRITLYSHAVSINPDSAASYNMLGFGYQLARQADLAGAAYQRSLQLDPDEVGVRRNLAMNLMDRGLYSAALDQWRRIARTNVPDRRRHAADLEQVGIALVMMGRAREAIPPLREAYKTYPDSRIQQWLDRARRAATEPATRSLR